MPEIHLPGKIIFGKDKVNDFHPESCEHAILICDSEMLQNRGFLETIKSKSTKMISHVSVAVNYDVHKLYAEASEMFFENEADMIIAAGSSAAIDCGMLLSYESKAKFTAIPCCGSCAMTDFESGRYYTYRHSPDTIILDPSIIRCVPSGMIAYDGMACLSYAIDTLKNTDNIITRQFAVNGAVGILKNIIPAYRGNIAALEQLMYAMYFAVVAHRNGADPEASVMSRTSEFFAGFGYPRSSVCALIIPNIMEEEYTFLKNSLFEIAVKSDIAHADDYPDFAVSKLIDKVRKTQACLGIPRSISGFGLNENEYRNKKSSTNVSDDLLDLCYYGSFKFMKL
ncbi:MAG: iron-containing alcohol dehydrogenase [Clostridia bacterium]|nr:iron-containing alcohol dehydrogenase [Clostridia bacterium]